MQSYPLKGGLDLSTAKAGANPGTLLDCLNYEVTDVDGYTRIGGFERFDGTCRIADQQWLRLRGVLAGGTFQPGDKITLGGSTGYVTALGTGSAWALYAAFPSRFTAPVLPATLANASRSGAATVQVIDTMAQPTGKQAAVNAARKALTDAARPSIGLVPGSPAMPVAGMFWFKNRLHAIRDYPLVWFESAKQWPFRVGDKVTFPGGIYTVVAVHYTSDAYLAGYMVVWPLDQAGTPMTVAPSPGDLLTRPSAFTAWDMGGSALGELPMAMMGTLNTGDSKATVTAPASQGGSTGDTLTTTAFRAPAGLWKATTGGWQWVDLKREAQFGAGTAAFGSFVAGNLGPGAAPLASGIRFGGKALLNGADVTTAVGADDGTDAPLSGQPSDELRVTGFDLSAIPDTAAILGVTVRIKRHALAGGKVQDDTVELVGLDGTSTSKASLVAWDGRADTGDGGLFDGQRPAQDAIPDAPQANEPMPSRADAAGRPTHAPDAVRGAATKAWGNRFIKKLENAGILHFIDTAEAVRRGLGTTDELQGVKGMYLDGKAYVLTDQVRDLSHVPGIVVHESGLHFGYDRLTKPEERQQLRRQVNRALAGGDADMVKAWQHAEKVGTPARHLHEEAMAYLVEHKPGSDVATRVVDAVKRGLNRAGVPLNLLESDSEAIRRTARDMLRRAARGEGVPKRARVDENGAQDWRASSINGAPVFSRAYHGTPHRGIEREGFKLEKIGTGEGAQAYGHGIYFAGNQAVAEHYRTGLSERDFTDAARDAYDEYSSPSEAEQAMLSIPGLSESQKELVRALKKDDWLGFDYPHQGIRAALREPHNFELSPETQEALRKQGQLYHAEVPEDHELLDWDKPLAEQPEGVRAKLDAANLHDYRPKEVDDGENYYWTLVDQNGHRAPGSNSYATQAEALKDLPDTGRDIYDRLRAKHGGARQASEYLNSIGIPGLRYLDGGSRGKGDGSHNYVVWDEAHLNNDVTPYYSRYRPERPIHADDDTAAGWGMLAQRDETFQLPASDARTVDGVFRDVDPAVKIDEAMELAAKNEEDPDRAWRITMPEAKNGAPSAKGVIYQKGDAVWIDVSDLDKGGGGASVYSAVANYAHNTGRVFIGDPAGLSNTALKRRTEQMLSSALKFGTTRHLWPHPRQVEGDAGRGVPPLRWKDGEDAHNIGELARVAAENTTQEFPEIRNLSYDARTDRFLRPDGSEVSRADFDRIAERAREDHWRAASMGDARDGALRAQPTAGGRSLERAVVTHGLSRRAGGEESGLLEAARGQSPDGVRRLDGVLYSRDAPSGERDLIVQHNLSASKLLHADRMGGLAVPSIAVTRSGHPNESFGDITLLGEKGMVDPKAGAKVYGADIYSPRYPEVQYQASGDVLRHLSATLKPYFQGDTLRLDQHDVAQALRQSPIFKRWADANGIKTTSFDAMETAARSMLREAGAKEVMFNGYTNNGNRRYQPHTLENVVKRLKKDLRGGENWNYGAGSLRAHFTPQFRSIEAIRKEKGRLVSEQDFEPLREEVNDELLGIVDDLRPHSARGKEYDFGDAVIGALEDAGKQGIPRAMAEYGINVPSDLQPKIGEFLTKLRHLPTAYFEAKLVRPVGLSEFRHAVVPADTSREVLAALAKHGIAVSTYDPKVPGDRARVIDAASRGNDLRFSRDAETRVNYESRIDELFDGGKPNREGVRVLDEGDVLTLTGHGKLPVVVNESHAVAEGRYNHPLTREQWKRMPEWIDNPAAVFERVRDGHLTMIGPEKVNGHAVVIGLEPAVPPPHRSGGDPRHLVLTAFEKDRGTLALQRLVEDGELRPLYLDEKKGPTFYAGSGVQFPGRAAELRASNKTLRTERDLVKYRAERDGDARHSRDLLGDEDGHAAVVRRQADASRASVLNQLAAQGYAQGAIGWTGNPNEYHGWRAGVQSAIAKLADKYAPVRRAQRAIEDATGQKLADDADVYRLENLMHGRAADRLDALDRVTVKPILKSMKQLGVAPKLLMDYLYARHAPERNARIATINPEMPDGGSGLTTAQARDILAGRADGVYSGQRITPDNLPKLQMLAARVDRLRDQTIATLEQSGQITPALAASLRRQWQHYVPLRGKEAEHGDGHQAVGRGVDIKGKPVRRALGRGDGNTAPPNILAEMIGDAQRAIIQGEKARVGRAILKLAAEHPNPDLWEVAPVDLEWKFSDATGEAYLAARAPNNDKDVLTVMHDGTPYHVRLVDPRIRDAVLNLGAEKGAAVVKFLGSINRWFSAVATRYNPAFVPVNAMRDAVIGFTGLAAEHGAGVAGSAAKLYLPAMRAVWRDIGRAPGDASVPDAQKKMDDWAREFAERGGKTGLIHFADLDATTRHIEDSFKSALDILRETDLSLHGAGRPFAAAGKALAKFQPVVHVVERANEAAENALRLAAYAALRQRGMSPDRAASYAKDLTVNFNRKGSVGGIMNSLFLFYNAGVQGVRRGGQLLKNPKVAAFMGGMMALQAQQSAVLMARQGDDGVSDWDAIPEWKKQRSFIIALPGKGHYFALPMPYEFGWFTYAGGRITQAVMDKEPSRRNSIVADLGAAALQDFFPIPLDTGMSGLIPKPIKVFTDLSANKNDFGRRITNVNDYTKFDTPRASLGKTGTPDPYVWMAKALNRVGGGDDFRPPQVAQSLLDWSPEDLQYLTEQATGGLGSFVNGTYASAQKALAGNYGKTKGDNVPVDWQGVLADLPILKAFGWEANQNAARSARFYDVRDELERTKAEVQNKLDHGDMAGAQRVARKAGVFADGLSIKTNADGSAATRMKKVDNRMVRTYQLGAEPGTLAAAYKEASSGLSQRNEDTGYNVKVQNGVADYNRQIQAAYALPGAERRRAIKALQDERGGLMGAYLRVYEQRKRAVPTPGK